MALSCHTTNQWRASQDEISPGLQRDRSHTDQAYCHWLELSSTYGKVLHRLEMCFLACVSSVCALDSGHISPPHYNTARCVETQH